MGRPVSTALDWIGSTEPEHLEDFTRLRAQRIPDPYNPDRTVEDWTTPDELPLRGSWDSTGSSFGSDPVRMPLTTTKRIAIFTPLADVAAGDRIRTADGAIFTVTGRPARDINPWTGWRPTTVLTVEEGEG